MVGSNSTAFGRNVVDHPIVNQTASFFDTPTASIWMASFGLNHEADHHVFSSRPKRIITVLRANKEVARVVVADLVEYGL
jgi:hypothetical protein